MLLAFILCTTITLSATSPFHKYPYVFLLDVGNEELEKTNTEQLRVSIPGGSLAIKYPVLGEGDTISHVRVSGIDFGTDLKVNIVDGGPGYKYVVLVFMGNPGISYDAVVTLDTLPNGTDTDGANTNQIDDTKIEGNSNSYKVSDPESDNDEDSDEQSMTMKQYSAKSNSEVMQSSSTYYNYANGAISDGDSDEESEDSSAEEQDNTDSNEDEESNASNEDSNEDSLEGEVDDGDENVEKIYFRPSNNIVSPRAEQYTSYIQDSSNSDDKPADILDDSLYEKYQDLKPHFGDGFKVYPKSFINSKQYQVNSGYDKEDPVELEQMFNDEEVHNDGKYSDDDNSIDSDYEAAEY